MKAIINESKIFEILKASSQPSQQRIKQVLEKAKEKKGLSLEEVGLLVNISDRDLEGLFSAAYGVKNEIYGERLVFFAPLYVSDYCVNDCEYCNFHLCNRELKRKRLTLEEVGEQTEFLINMGHKRLLLEFGEDPEHNDIDYVTSVIEKIYSIRTPKGNIRRLNVNIAATTVENYRRLKAAHIGTYQLFQETYHRKTYESLHHGPKADYQRQITAHTRAFSAGLDDLGLGVLFGLYDWRFEVLGIVSHAQYMDKKYGVGPHTISVPRFQYAQTVTFKPQYPVSERDFLKLIAILRLAVPYTGMIISTRERPEIRRQAFKIGISQASAASRTTTGGYGKAKVAEQFTLQDERSLEEVIRDIVSQGFLPSFCTACYRRGRTGAKFMQLSKPGEIHNFCRPNGLLTFAEYLQDFTTDGLRTKGQELIQSYLNKIQDASLRQATFERLEKIKQGERDLYI
jgi:2-iminoacetate synthase